MTSAKSGALRALLLATIILPSANAVAQQRSLVDISTTFDPGKTYTITSASNYQMYANSNGTALVSVSNSNSPNEEAAYQFAFVADPNDATKFYLYNVGAEKFVGYSSTFSNANTILHTGSADQVFVWTPGNENFRAKNCIYVISFNGDITNWSNSGGSTNNTYHVFQCAANVTINDWTSIGVGGNNSFNISEAGTFSEADLATAQAFLGSYTATNFATAGITRDTKIYSLKSEAGSYLVATTSGLSSSTTATAADANAQFVFITDPTDATKTLLYSVGQEKFIATNLQFGTGSAVGRISPFQTNDAHGYGLALSFSETWGGDRVVNTAGSSSADPDKSNRFQIEDAGDFSAESLAAAKTFFTGSYVATDYSTAGITLNTRVYTLKSETGSYLSATSNSLSGSTTAGANAQFVFIEDPNTPGKIALYSVGQKKFVTSTRGLVEGDAAQVYPFQTNDSHGYGLAFSLNETWGGGQVVNIAGSTSANPDRANRFQLEAVSTLSIDDYRAAVRRFNALATTYTTNKTASELAALGIIVDKEIYTIATSEPTARGVLCATSSGLSKTKTVSADDPAQQFVFIQDPNDETKVYLYNVTQEKFFNRANLVSGKSAVPIYVYNTDNYDYSVALSFSTSGNFHTEEGNDRSGNSNVTISDYLNLISTYSKFDAGTRFKCSKVGDLSDADLAAAKAFLSGYTKTDLATAGVTADTKVYSLVSENGSRLVATGSGLSGSTTATAADANAQFVFMADVNDATKTILYSVGQGRFLKADRTLGSGSEAGAVYPFTTSDADNGYSLAFGFSETWGSGQVVNTAGSSSADPDKANRFKIEDVTEQSNYKTSWKEDVYKGRYTKSSLSEMGLNLNTVYYFYSDWGTDMKVLAATDRMDRNSKNNRSLAEQDVEKVVAQFAFVPDPKDDSKIYLYSLNAKKAANSSGDEVIGTSLDPIYVYATHNADFPLAFSFSSEAWDADGAISIRADQAKDVTTNNSISPYNRFHFIELTEPTKSFSQAEAQLNLYPPFHYKGASGRAFMSNGMQNTAEYHYYYYITNETKEYKRSSDMHAVELMLPLLNYLSRDANGNIVESERTGLGYQSRGNNMEPGAYFRWYDYRTDQGTDRIGKWDDWSGHSFNRLSKYTSSDGIDRGLVGYNLNWGSGMSGPAAANIGVYYEIPDSAQSESWSGDVIACDVSRYADYSVPMKADSTGVYEDETLQLGSFSHEPTLSIRYVYHILPAAKLAAEIRDEATTQGRGIKKTYADKGVLSWGVRDENVSTMNLRADLQYLGAYWFYPLNEPNVRHVYHPDDNTDNAINNVNQFGKTMKQAATLEWRVYNSDKTAWRTIASGLTSRTIDITLNGTYGLNGNNWNPINSSVTLPAGGVKIAKGDRCYVVGMLVAADGSKCPFFNAEIHLTNNYPKTDAQISADNNDHRKEATMRELYGNPVAQFEFDNDNDQMDYTAPEGDNTASNFTTIPSPFATRQYSFVYPQLGAFSQLNYNVPSKTYSPLHGDYIYAKHYSNAYDRTYEKENGARYGYFLFTDASDESRQLGSQEFEGSLCSGMDLVISAYIANGSTGSDRGQDSEQPEVRFTLYGIEKDAQNNITEERPLASICSGNFKNNAEGYSVASSAGVWYQVYGVMTLPEDLNVEQYTDFRVSIDNFCKNTWGADYAIDDISIFQNPSKLVVIQSPPVCHDGTIDDVMFKLKGGYEVLRDLTKKVNNKRQVYYRFYTGDRQPVTGPDFYGAGHDDYGVVEIPDTYSSTAKLGAEDDNCLQFETTDDGEELIVLANRHYKLELSKTYYLALATGSIEQTDADNNKILVPNDSTWGVPSNVCSFYSNMFTVVVQNLVINGEENGTALLNIDCDKDTTMGYTISAGLTLPDHENGGKIIVNTSKFDWFAGTKTQFNDVENLKEALQAFRDEYPEATDYDQTLKGKYTQAYKDVLAANVYNRTTKPDGRLRLTCSSSLSDYPVAVGTHTFTAIITSDTLRYNGSTYNLCTEPLEFTIRAAKNGPRLSLGIPGIQYPAGETTRAIRLGFPQIRAMGATGTLRIPILARYFGTSESAVAEDLLVMDQDGEIYISATNDPSFKLDGTDANLRIADVAVTNLIADSTYLDLRNFNTSILHEGYWYETSVTFTINKESSTSSDEGGSSTMVNCPGETFFRIKVVPEYLTWNPTSELGLGSNWNNDLNWRRSTAAELFKPDYTDYRTATYTFDLYDRDGKEVEEKTNPVDTRLTTESRQPYSYTPMYFSKVIIPTLTTQPYPMMGYIRRNVTTGLVMSMVNGKGSGRTANIEYDMMANAAGTAVGSTADSIYKCVVFDGNLCKEIWFKTGAQLRAEQYLNYQRAWCELALPVNGWGTFTSPMASSFAGEMYLPKYNARQETEGFREIRYNDQDKVYRDANNNITYDPQKATDPTTYYGLFGKAGAQLYNRLRMPTYQMSWGQNQNEVLEDGSSYGSHDNPTEMLIYPRVEQGDNVDLRGGEDYTLKRNAWSHVFNDLSVKYESCVGMAGKIGDDYATPLSSEKWATAYALMRLPKSDDEYTYYKRDGDSAAPTGNTVKTTTDHYRLAVPYDNSENSMGQMQHRTYSVMPYPQQADGSFDYSKANRYVLMANPYTATISVQRFVDANSDKMMTVERNGEQVYRVWTYYNNVLYELAPDGVSSIAPGQAFFIRVETPGKDNITFTERMQIDPNINSGAVVAAAAQAPKRIAYTVKSAEEVTKALSAIDAAGDVQMWSPREGWVAVSGATDLRIGVYTTDGTQIHDARSSAGATKQLYTGKGIYIVRATTPDGKTIARKLAVK